MAAELQSLLTRVKTEGSTDANVAAFAVLEEKIAAADKAALPTAKPDKLRAFNRAIHNGFDTGMGFKLGLSETDRNAFAQMLLLTITAKEQGAIQSDTPQTIADIGGATHTVTTAQFIRLMLAYGTHYKALWDALKAED